MYTRSIVNGMNEEAHDLLMVKNGNGRMTFCNCSSSRIGAQLQPASN